MLRQTLTIGLLCLLMTFATADTRIVDVGTDFSTAFRDQFSHNVNTVIDVGDTVRWQWISGSHTTTSATNLWNANLNSVTRTFNFTFNQPGTFNYRCVPHGACCGMLGSVIVRLPGDVNRDGCVNDEDLLAVLFAFGQNGRGIAADLNYDLSVNDDDLLKVLFNFGNGC
ncbi:MAG: hypothetical protein KIT45_14225 [Fimbriimonadia bacterium]|nr:hypothetical protein [Fimbriimonadia bacterium]